MHPHFAEQQARLHRLDLERVAAAARLRPPRGRSRRPDLLAAVGRVLVKAGGRLVAGRRPDPAPCPWCDGAFPARCRPEPIDPAVVGLRPGC